MLSPFSPALCALCRVTALHSPASAVDRHAEVLTAEITKGTEKLQAHTLAPALSHTRVHTHTICSHTHICTLTHAHSPTFSHLSLRHAHIFSRPHTHARLLGTQDERGLYWEGAGAGAGRACGRTSRRTSADFHAAYSVRGLRADGQTKLDSLIVFSG